MSSRIQKSQKRLEKSLQRYSKKEIVIGTLIGTIIAATPYFFYMHTSVPETSSWSTFLFTYESAYFEDVNYVMWMFTGKAIPLLLLLFWFFTNRHWWYHALLVPIVMYIYQIIILFNDDYSYIDNFQLIYLVPIMAMVIPSIYLIRAQMFDKINNADKTLEDLEEEFMFKPKSLFKKLGDYF